MGNFNCCFLFHNYNSPYSVEIMDTDTFIDYNGKYFYASKPVMIRREYYRCNKCRKEYQRDRKFISLYSGQMFL